jgi:kojibiose phosphorylase
VPAEKLWKVINRDYGEKAVNFSTSIFTISNGYMALKGDMQEFPVGRYTTTIINGLFDRIKIFSLLSPSNRERRYLDPEYFDSAGPSPSVANLPDPIFTQIFVGGRQVSFALGDIRDFQQVYDLQRGLYSYEFEFEDPDGKATRISMTRFCDMEKLHRAFLRYEITPINHNEEITIRTGIDASIKSNVTGEKQIEVTNQQANGKMLCLDSETLSSKIKVHTAVVIKFHEPDKIVMTPTYEEKKLYFVFTVHSCKNDSVIFDKAMIIASSLDSNHDVECTVRNELHDAEKEGFDAAAARNAKYWESLWKTIDVKIEGDNLAQLYMRFALYHLAAAAPRHSGRLSVPCKLLTGEYYQGTTFYDTDLYIEPLYIFTNPDWARNCLSYRWHALMPAKTIAENLGFKGAKFAWQSGPDGIECLGDWYRFTKTNIHINSDVAYSLLLYWRTTGDYDFMIGKGLDILVETSRFLASRASYNEESASYDIQGVTGPDEGHVACTNEFYTNYLAAKNLLFACDFLEMLKAKRPRIFKKTVERLFISNEEMANWSDISKKLTFYFDGKTKVYEQCKDFYKLKQVPDDFLNKRDAWFATVFPYQALNQPDVVMAMALYREEFTEDVKRANWEFYKPRSMNFSSMSYVINSMMAKEMGEMEDAYRDFMISAGMDIDPALTGRNDTHEGLHGTALGGAWMAAVFGFGGILFGKQGLVVDPKLPKGWESLEFNIILHGERLHFRIMSKSIEIVLDKNASVSIPAIIAGKMADLLSGEKYQFIYGN